MLSFAFRLRKQDEQQIAGEVLQPHDIELQRAPVVSYEELSGDRRPLFQ